MLLQLKMEKEKINRKREQWDIKIGPMMKKVLIKQREKIKEATYGIEKSSDYTAGEIIAKKILDNDLI